MLEALELEAGSLIRIESTPRPSIELHPHPLSPNDQQLRRQARRRGTP